MTTEREDLNAPLPLSPAQTLHVLCRDRTQICYSNSNNITVMRPEFLGTAASNGPVV
jgi:hypothetical protein